jgi:hypothetical protein
MKALFLHKQNTKKVFKTKKQSSAVLKAFQDDMCFNFVQRQTNAMQK